MIRRLPVVAVLFASLASLDLQGGNEGGRVLELYFDRIKNTIYVPSDAKWNEIMPSWATDRKAEIMSRIKQHVGKDGLVRAGRTRKATPRINEPKAVSSQEFVDHKAKKDYRTALSAQETADCLLRAYATADPNADPEINATATTGCRLLPGTTCL